MTNPTPPEVALLPCPLCGNTTCRILPGQYAFAMQCTSCRAIGPREVSLDEKLTAEDAVAKWNRRTPDALTAANNARVVAALLSGELLPGYPRDYWFVGGYSKPFKLPDAITALLGTEAVATCKDSLQVATLMEQNAALERALREARETLVRHGIDSVVPDPLTAARREVEAAAAKAWVKRRDHYGNGYTVESELFVLQADIEVDSAYAVLQQLEAAAPGKGEPQ